MPRKLLISGNRFPHCLLTFAGFIFCCVPAVAQETKPGMWVAPSRPTFARLLGLGPQVVTGTKFDERNQGVYGNRRHA